MSKSPLNINLVQYDIAWENPARNLLKLEDLLRDANPADLTILPEMFTTGFTMNASAMAEPMTGASVEWMNETAKMLRGDLLGSLIIEDGSQYFNRLIWMGPDGIRGTYDKRHLFTMAGEDRVYMAGSERVMVQHLGWNCYPFICYDVRFPVWSRVGNKAEVLIFIANFPDKRADAWSKLLVARAIENQCYVIGVNRIGWDGEQNYYSGASVVIDPLGNEILQMEETQGIGQAALDNVSLEIVRRDMPFLNDADKFELI
ncbi:UNVERIFIED_CONTAM: hypothetical protein GTU68_043607 [Idotea baltica]|nr:hypothetical protein [Idotea baltica]